MTLLTKYLKFRQSIRESIDVPPESMVGRVKSMYDSQRYDITPQHKENGIEFHAIAKRPQNAVSFHDRKVPNPTIKYEAWHDPEISTLVTPYQEDQFPRTHAVLKPDSGYHQQIQDEPRQGVLYRGMSHEEFQNVKKTGVIHSKGDYNIGKEQEGLTYYSKSPSQAQSYSHSFAPIEGKASGLHHAYVVAVKDPQTGVKVAGTGEDEVGIPHPIKVEDILHVHVGRAYQGSHGSHESVKEWGGKYVPGSGSDPLTSVGWKREKFSNL